MTTSASVLSDIQTVQAALQVMQTMLQLTAFRFPPECSPDDGSFHDYIVVGAGTAGSVLANRLTANADYDVLVLEEGGPAPMEAELAGLYAYLQDSKYDYNFTSVPDNYTAQNLKGGRVTLTQGKMLGGSSSLAHHVHVRGNAHDYDNWAEILNNPDWKYENLLPYFKKAEKIVDEDFCATRYAKQYGTDGPIKITRERDPVNKPILDSFAELGYNVDDDVILGVNEPLMSNADHLRQSTAFTYLSEAKTRDNLCVATNTMATKILIEDGKAIGVQVTDPNGDTKVHYANKEVIVCAGTINSPKLLMLSGIGPKDHLESLGIDVVADLPVGKNFLDQSTAILTYNLERNTNPPPPMNPYKFPIPMTTGYVALDPEQTYADFQSYNLRIPAGSIGLLELCSQLFKFTDSFCDKLFSATAGRNALMSCITFLVPDSKGEVLLASSDPNDSPLIYTGAYSEKSDLKSMAAILKKHNEILDTTYFKSVNATLVDTGLCKDAISDDEFWECYALATTSSTMHIVGTNAMGSVLDSKLKVIGVDRLRVVDSSAMPTLTRGNPHADVLMIAERAADYIVEG